MIEGTVGTDPALAYMVAPTGGIITLEPSSAADFSTWTLTRYFSVSGVNVSGSVLVQGAAGQPSTQVVIDIGDGTNMPLDSTQLYVYELNTGLGSVQTPPLSPACSLVLEQDQVSAILYRGLQAGIEALVLPAAFRNRPQVIHQMPLAGTGLPTLPAIAFNESLLQPQTFRIGEDVDTDYQHNSWQIAVQAVRHYTIFVLTNNVKEREYYKDAVVAIFDGLLPVLNKIGNNITHRFQVSTSQITGRANEPGFYFAEIMLEYVGLYSVGINTSYGVVSGFTFDFIESQETVLIN